MTSHCHWGRSIAGPFSSLEPVLKDKMHVLGKQYFKETALMHTTTVLLDTVLLYLQIFLSVENDRLRFNLSVLDINFVATQDNGNILTDSSEISVPLRDILISHSRCDIKHNDATLTLDVIAVTKTAKLLLSGSIPDIKTYWSKIRVEN